MYSNIVLRSTHLAKFENEILLTKYMFNKLDLILLDDNQPKTKTKEIKAQLCVKANHLQIKFEVKSTQKQQI